MNNYTTVIFPIQWKRIEEALNCAKLMKSTYSVIPRDIWQYDVYTSIIGVSDGKIDYCNFKINGGYLWEEPRQLHHLVLFTKYIQQFTIYCKNNNVNYENLDLVCHEYIVNGEKTYVGIALYPKDNRDISIPLENAPYKYIKLVDETIDKFNGSTPICGNELTNDEKFMDIINSKVDTGGKLWTVESGFKKYPVYISSNMMKVNKSDKIFYELRHNIPNQKYGTFMVRFQITKGIGNIYTYLNLVNIFER